MKKFARLFEFEDIGQVLVKLGNSQIDESEAEKDESVQPEPNETERSELRFYFKLPGLGICEAAFGYCDDEDWSKAAAVLDDLNEQQIRSVYNYMADSAVVEACAATVE